MFDSFQDIKRELKDKRTHHGHFSSKLMMRLFEEFPLDDGVWDDLHETEDDEELKDKLL